MMDMGGGGGGMGGGGSGGGMGGLEQLLQMLGGGKGKEGGGQGGGYNPDAGKSTMDKMDMFGNIADGSRLTPPAQHSELNQPAQPVQAAPMAPGSQGQQAPRSAPTIPSPQALNNDNRGMMGYNDAQGQALDDYAAEELKRREASMNIA